MLDRICKDDAEALRMLMEAAKHQGSRGDFVDNINEVERSSGTTKSYTLDRLYRERLVERRLPQVRRQG